MESEQEGDLGSILLVSVSRPHAKLLSLLISMGVKRLEAVLVQVTLKSEGSL